MTPEDLAAAGLSDFALLPDEAVPEVVDEIEAMLKNDEGTPGSQAALLIRARLDGFVYGYRLGIRPKDTQPVQDL